MGNTASQSSSSDGAPSSRPTRRTRRTKSVDDSVLVSTKDGRKAIAPSSTSSRRRPLERAKSVGFLMLSKRQSEQIMESETSARNHTLDQILEFVQTIKEEDTDGDSLLLKFIEQQTKKSGYNLKKALEEDEAENIFLPRNIEVQQRERQPNVPVAKGA